MTSTLDAAIAKFSENKISEAELLFRSLVDEEPMNLKALYHLGVCEFRLQDFEAAGKHFQEYTNIDPENVNARYYQGLCHERQGREDFAQKHFRVALKLNPDYKPAMKKLGISEPVIEAPSEVSEASQPEETDYGQPTVSPNEVFTFDKKSGPGELIYTSPRRRLTSFSWRLCVFSVVLALTILIGIPYVLGEFGRSDERVFGWILIVCVLLLLIIGPNWFLASRFTEYKIFERRIDIKTGFLFRKQLSLWLFEVTDIQLTRSPVEVLTRNATLVLSTEKEDVPIKGLLKRKGIDQGSTEFVQALFDQLRAVVREQRGEIKKVWI